jgi:hypothetical protein
MIHYKKDKTNFGPSTTQINSKLAHLNSLKQTVKTVVLSKEEFTVENLKTVLKNKISGIISIVGNDNFVPSKEWDIAYQYLCNSSIYYIV